MGSKTRHLRRVAQKMVDAATKPFEMLREYIFEPAPQRQDRRFWRPFENEYTAPTEPPRVRHRTVRGEVKSRRARKLIAMNAARAAAVDRVVRERLTRRETAEEP